MAARMSVTGWIVAVLCVLAVSIVGAVAGRWFAGWRQAEAQRAQLEEIYSQVELVLKVGDTIPQLELLDQNGEPVTTSDLIRGRSALILFLSPVCESCTEIIEEYRAASSALPTNSVVFAVMPGMPEGVQRFARQHDLPFPLYCDSAQLFQSEYGIIAFPTLLTTDGSGVIRRLNLGMMEDYSLTDAMSEAGHW